MGKSHPGERPAIVPHTLPANGKIHGLAPEIYLTEVIKRLPHNATAEQAAELTPARFASQRADAEQFACPTPATKIQALAMGMI